jgi:hypothetical protein
LVPEIASVPLGRTAEEGDPHLFAHEIAIVVSLRDRLKRMPGYSAISSDWPGVRRPVLTDKTRNHFGWRPTFKVMDLYRRR